jgi:hypothetical protein
LVIADARTLQTRWRPVDPGELHRRCSNSSGTILYPLALLLRISAIKIWRVSNKIVST